MTWRTDLLPPAPWAEALCDLLPTLRGAAQAIEPRRAAAETLLYDAILETLLSGTAEAPGAARLFSLMRTARRLQTRVEDRCALRGSLPCPTDAERRCQAAAILALPAPEREAVVLLTLLRAPPERAAELAGATQAALLARRASGEARLAGGASSHRRGVAAIGAV